MKPETRHVTLEAYEYAVELGYASYDDISEAIILNITPHDFVHSMPSNTKPGLFQDVYKKTMNGVKLYIKLQENPKGRGVVIQFKRDTSAGGK